MVFSNLLLIWVSYIVNNYHVVAVVLKEASPKVGPNVSPEMYYVSICTMEEVRKVCEFECHTPL